MSSDIAECGCAGHADQQIPECTYSEVRNVFYMLLKRLEEEHGKSVLLSSTMLQEVELAKAVLKGKRIDLTHECLKCYRYWTHDFIRCPICNGVVAERRE